MRKSRLFFFRGGGKEGQLFGESSGVSRMREGGMTPVEKSTVKRGPRDKSLDSSGMVRVFLSKKNKSR